MAIGTAAAILGSSAIGALGSSKAASAQSAAADKQLKLQREIYDEQTKNFAPFLQGGTNAFDALLYEMGLGQAPTVGGTLPGIETITEAIPGAIGGSSNPNDINYMGPNAGGPTERTRYSVGGQMFDSMDAAEQYRGTLTPEGGTTYGGYTKTPGYDFRLQQGVNALDSSAAARGNLFSGAQAKALTQFGQDFGANEWTNYIARLTGLAGQGQSAAGNQANAGANFAGNAGNALAAQGNAQAAGWIGATNAAQNGLNNFLGYQQMQQLLG